MYGNERMANITRGAAMTAAASVLAPPRIGIVDSYDPNRYMVKLLLQPENALTGWLPIGAIWMGNGWGMFCPPTPGDQMTVEFIGGAKDYGIACLRLYSNVKIPQAALAGAAAAGVPSGEFWLVHKSGSFLTLTNDGGVKLYCSSGSYLTMLPDGTVKVHSTVVVDVGDVGSTLHQLVHDAFRTFFNSHVHGNGNGGANTTAPTQPMTLADHFTQKLKAN